MLLPFFYSYVCGRCQATYWHVTATEGGRCYCQVADGMVTVGWVTGGCYYQVGIWYCHGSVIYFILSSEMLNRTSSQMCGRWYLPMFLFRDGLLTLIYRASLMVLIRFWSSLPTMLKLSRLIL